MNILFLLILGSLFGFLIKKVVNWLSIDNYVLNIKNPILEILNGLASGWAFSNLSFYDSLIFIMLFGVLSGLSIIDMYTFQIPVLFIVFGILILILGLFFKIMPILSAFWGVFVGAFIPLLIMGSLWLVTKRQGMGYGDIQLGFLLGAWLGPMRMAITLFIASSLSLLIWIITSLFKGFNKDRAMPMAPFLSISGVLTFIGSFYYPNFFQLLVFK
jgi:prepilin signal peptidase PulO-like enzyme (type II secretory pathway)